MDCCYCWLALGCHMLTIFSSVQEETNHSKKALFKIPEKSNLEQENTLKEDGLLAD